MKLSLTWLKEYIAGDYTAKDVEAALISLGLEVEDVVDEGASLKDFVLAHIDAAEKHPDADRLQICAVNTGNTLLNIVCGGKNARTGIYVALAPVGALIPSTQHILKLGNVRGVESQGMLCSAEELLLELPCDGILEINPLVAQKHNLGASLGDVLNLKDVMFDISITPNRSDCFSIHGIARDIFAYFSYHGKTVTWHEPKISPPNRIEALSPLVINHAPRACTAFHLTKVSHVTNNGEIPPWLKQKLHSVGVRPRSPLVDITNYLCFAWGRPLHVFDADKVVGALTLRLSTKGEKFEALDDKIHTLDTGMLVMCDEDGIISLAGIMGGKRTAVTETTTHVLLESALFDPVSIALTGQKLTILSDSRTRFERGVDGSCVESGSAYALNLIHALCGGKIHQTTVIAQEKIPEKNITLPFTKLTRMTGQDIAPSEVERILNLLGFATVAQNSESITVTLPPWRIDVSIAEDLIEEVVRLRGVDAIETLPMPHAPLPQQAAPPSPEKIAARVLTHLGFHEAVTFSFLDVPLAQLFSKEHELIHIDNPISTDLSVMRPSILGTLLQIASKNKKMGRTGCAFFESGPIFHASAKEKQHTMITALQCDVVHEGNWQNPEEKADFFSIKKSLFTTLNSLGLEEKNITITRETPPYYHPGQSGAVKQGARIIAYFGALHPTVIKHGELSKNTVGFEIFVENLPQKRKKPLVKDVPSLQPVIKDFAFVVNKIYDAGTMLNILWSKLPRQKDFPKNTQLVDVNLFDVFEQFKEESMVDKKSLALTLTLQPEKHTLNDEDLTAFMQSVITLIETETGGKLRT